MIMPRERMNWIARYAAEIGAVVCFALGSTMTFAGPLSQGGFPIQIHRSFEPFLSDSVIDDETDLRTVVPDQLRRRIVNYPSTQAPGTVVVDTPNTYLYYVIGGGKAIRYGIGVGREGFTWSGVKTVDQKSEWPDWIPPTEMIQRQPYLPRFMAGGPQNPLGARAIYLSGTLYRIHGTNAPSTIGKHVSSGCIRMLNEDVIDLYARVRIGSKIVVLPMTAPQTQKNVGEAWPGGSHMPPRVTSTVRMFGIY
jgi:lipoprotein-anchoring transpeptidase ErfK/SrfK